MLSGPDSHVVDRTEVIARLGRQLLFVLAIVVPILGGMLVQHGCRIRKAVAAACQQAQPLIDRRASRVEVLGALGPGWIPDGTSAPGSKAGRVIYSTGEYIMYISFDSTDHAVKAECVNQ